MDMAPDKAPDVLTDIPIEYLIVDVARLYKTIYDQKAGPRIGLTQAQSRTLNHLARNEGINQAGLAEILEVQPITLARTIDRLSADGWMERRPHPTDRRAFTLHLLPKAEPVLDLMRELALELREVLLRTLSEEERQSFAKSLATLRDNLTAADMRTERKTMKEGAKNASG